jgi:hypothetical protein
MPVGDGRFAPNRVGAAPAVRRRSRCSCPTFLDSRSVVKSESGRSGPGRLRPSCRVTCREPGESWVSDVHTLAPQRTGLPALDKDHRPEGGASALSDAAFDAMRGANVEVVALGRAATRSTGPGGAGRPAVRALNGRAIDLSRDTASGVLWRGDLVGPPREDPRPPAPRVPHRLVGHRPRHFGDRCHREARPARPHRGVCLSRGQGLHVGDEGSSPPPASLSRLAPEPSSHGSRAGAVPMRRRQSVADRCRAWWSARNRSASSRSERRWPSTLIAWAAFRRAVVWENIRNGLGTEMRDMCGSPSRVEG